MHLQLKAITAIAVVVRVGAVVSVAGWATSTINQTPSVSPAPLNPRGVVTHDAYLERFLAGLKNLKCR
jgi:hypothetical protein